MRNLTNIEFNLIHGGASYAEIGKDIGGVIGTIVIFPFALIMATFASDPGGVTGARNADFAFSVLTRSGQYAGNLMGYLLGTGVDKFSGHP